MKVVLLALSGDLSRWRDKLVQLYPHCSIDVISRAEFETGSHIKRLKSLRALRPDVLAIATERLPWQRGQTKPSGHRQPRTRASQSSGDP